MKNDSIDRVIYSLSCYHVIMCTVTTLSILSFSCQHTPYQVIMLSCIPSQLYQYIIFHVNIFLIKLSSCYYYHIVIMLLYLFQGEILPRVG